MIANAGSDAVAVPSLTEITMLPVPPVVPAGGVPLSRPVVVSNTAQLGRPVIANVSTLPSASLAVGTNVYAVPASTLVIGAPEMTGARFTGGGVTAMLNAGNATATAPSLTEIVMSANVPTLAASGVPCRRPVAASKVAHVGRLRIENVSGWRSASVAVGVNVYCARDERRGSRSAADDGRPVGAGNSASDLDVERRQHGLPAAVRYPDDDAAMHADVGRGRRPGQ